MLNIPSTRQIYATADDVVVLDLNLNLLSTLRFSEGFPARTSAWSSCPVTGVLANDDLGLVSSFRERRVHGKC
jgi:hypothetical protein